MPTFQLTLDNRDLDSFAYLGHPLSLSETLSTIRFDALVAAPSLRSEILRINQARRTAFLVPKNEWKALFFDMDSTVIAEESIIELAKAAGKESEVARITEQAMEGLLDFTAALKERVRMLKGLSLTVIDDVRAHLTINPGMQELSVAARSRGIKLYLVSGGFNALASRIANDLGFEGFLANELDSHAGTLNGELQGAIINAEAKAHFLLETCKKLRIHPSETLAIGDGANDLPMMNLAGASIGYYPKSVLLPHISGAIFESQDHSALIPTL